VAALPVEAAELGRAAPPLCDLQPRSSSLPNASFSISSRASATIDATVFGEVPGCASHHTNASPTENGFEGAGVAANSASRLDNFSAAIARLHERTPLLHRHAAHLEFTIFPLLKRHVRQGFNYKAFCIALGDKVPL
jgi:hypothetical protein